MRITVNQIARDFPQGTKVSQVLDYIQARPPFAVAVNLTFVPKTQYAECTLNENDAVEVIAPVTGG
jgi:sulfur carrier protein